jgi:nucleoside-diphosphate-sugar epimerase
MNWNQQFQFLQGKTILVTGATGLIGSNLTHALMDIKDITVIALSRSSEKLKACFGCYDHHENFMQVKHDIVHPIQLDCPPIDYIFHAAGPQERAVIENHPMQVIGANIQGTINCLDFLRQQKNASNINGRLILFSSVTVYGNNTNQDMVVSEHDTHITSGLDAFGATYAESKRLSEVICQSYYKEHMVDYVVARLSTIYGDSKHKTDTAFFEFISDALNGQSLTVNSNNLPRRDNLYIDDAITGLLTIAIKGSVGEAYNLSSNGDLGNFLAVDEIAQKITDITNKDFDKELSLNIKNISPDSKRLPGLILNNKKLKSLGWEVSTSFADGVKETLRQAAAGIQNE